MCVPQKLYLQYKRNEVGEMQATTWQVYAVSITNLACVNDFVLNQQVMHSLKHTLQQAYNVGKCHTTS